MTSAKQKNRAASKRDVGKKNKSPAPTQDGIHSAKAAFHVVGIGASAGGLEALKLFLGKTPTDTGLAFVIVQHLEAGHSSALIELLRGATRMPVVEIADQTEVQPNHVYLIPPASDLALQDGVLHLLAPQAARGFRLPIDFFFQSLAADCQERSVGVILSGMGSDGAQGVRAIKERSGAVFVQSPESAKFDSMPRSAIATGIVDVVAPAQELPDRILHHFRGRPPAVLHSAEVGDGDGDGLEKVVALLRGQTGQDFSQYKRNTLLRRIERRMGLHNISEINDYVRYLRENKPEKELLIQEFLIGVTRFFRDPEAWLQLKNEVLRDLIKGQTADVVLRAWVPACSTGEEAYSLAIVFKECIEEIKPKFDIRLQIFATDLNATAIAAARAGVFESDAVADVSEERLHRFFAPTDGGLKIRKDIRDMVIFAQQNAIGDPPFTKLDLLLCRNLLIYLETKLQERVMALFHFSLKPGGILMLGNSETVGATGELFTPLGGKSRLYRRTVADRGVQRPDFSAYSSMFRPAIVDVVPQPPSRALNVQALTDHYLLRAYAPPSVLVNDNGDILYFSGKTEKYLEPPVGKANLNLFNMARDGLDRVLARKFHRAVRDHSSVTIRSVKVMAGNSVHKVDVSIRPFSERDALHGMTLITFSDPAESEMDAAPADELAPDPDSSEELRRSNETLMIMREEMQAMREEFSATEEELQSAIEELQSTNEELSTSKEEMQSTNEELQSVNSELRMRLDQLSRASSDMNNLLNSTEIAVLFLDEASKVRRFSSQATAIFKLIPGDVGRPLSDLVNELDYPALATDVKEVMRNLIPKERQVAASGARWFTVRILPYRTNDNRIDGVVVILLDISQAKTLEAELRAARDHLQGKFSEQAQKLKQARADLDKE